MTAGRRRRLRLAFAGALGGGLVVVAIALGSGGTLTPKGCVSDNDSPPDICAQSTDGLSGVKGATVSPDGRSVYAAGLFDSAVVRFDRNRKTGALEPKGCIDDKQSGADTCAKSTEGLGGAEEVAVSPDDRSVYVSANSDSAIAILARNRKTGALKPRGCVGDKQHGPAGCAKHASGLYQARTPVVSPDGRFLYVASGEDDAVSIFARKRRTGALRPLGCVDDNDSGQDHCAKSTNGLTGAYDLTMSADGRSLYVGSEFDNAIVTFKRNTKTGALKPKGCIDDVQSGMDNCAKSTHGLDGIQGITVTRDGRSAYVTAGSDHAIVSFKRKRRTGALKPAGCIDDFSNGPDTCATSTPGLDAAIGVAASPDGKAVYVASADPANAVVAFARNRHTGALTPGDCVNDNDTSNLICANSTDGMNQTVEMAISPDSKSIYAVGESDAALVHLRR